MNPFQLTFPERLQEWVNLRQQLADSNLEDRCVAVDEWWQRAPLVNHYLHPLDTRNWPDPWQLLSENEYCRIARGLGMCYTLTLLGIQEHALCEIVDEYGDDYIIIRCDKYAMNWHPNSVVNTSLTSYRIKQTIDIAHLLNRLR